MRPELLDAALEAEEQALDAAQTALIDAMRIGEMSRRIRAAGILLRLSEAGRRRGFG